MCGFKSVSYKLHHYFFFSLTLSFSCVRQCCQLTLQKIVPSSPPESPKCDVLSSTSIYITWSPPPIDSQNGKIRGYKVFYIASDDIYEKEIHIVKSNNQYLTVENLKKYTNYSVWVLAYTKMGDGMKSNQFFCRTYEDGEHDTYSITHFSLARLCSLCVCGLASTSPTTFTRTVSLGIG